MTTVWAYRPLAELNNRTGFVECDEELAALLLSSDLVQDPRHGGTAMRNIEDAPPAPAVEPREREQEYGTKDMTAKPPRSKR